MTSLKSNIVSKTALMQSGVAQDIGNTMTLNNNPNTVGDDELKTWVEDLYSTNVKLNEQEIKQIYEVYKYQGFNREEVLKLLKLAAGDIKTSTHLIIVCALRGPQQASKTVLFNGKTALQMGIPASGGQGRKILTCNKISAATADLAAYHFKRLSVPKKLLVECPGWLQFPAAGSIKLPDDLRQQHLEFSKKFSATIGGEFQESIYAQMVSNAYLDKRLHLFE
jgi:hypothetical protein